MARWLDSSEDALASVIRYIKEDDLTEDDLQDLRGMIGSAEAYLTQAGVSLPEAGTARRDQYDLCLKAMVLDAWDTRGTQKSGASLVANAAFRDSIKQLQMTEPVPNLGTQ